MTKRMAKKTASPLLTTSTQTGSPAPATKPAPVRKPVQAKSVQTTKPVQAAPAKAPCPETEAKKAASQKIVHEKTVDEKTAPTLPQAPATAVHQPPAPQKIAPVEAAPVETAPVETAQDKAPDTQETPLSAAVLPESSVVADSLEHGQRVAAIVAMLFQDMAKLHKLGDIWGHRLHLAAQLHDIGFAEGRKEHHKISMRIIEEDLSLNIEDEDRPWVALLARYHRKAWPSCRHARFAALKKGERKELRKAASLLRIADALDYTHTGVVGQLGVEIRKRKVIITVQCAGDCSAEMQRVLKKGDLFMHVFGRELECICQEN